MGDRSEKNSNNENELAISIAALLVEAAVADEVYADSEKALIDRLLVSEFGVAQSDVAAIRTAAEARQREAVDLFRFVREVKTLSADDKIKFVEALWRVVLSDGDKDTYEDMLIRRLCGLIYVEDVDSGLARNRVLASLGR